MDLREKIGWWRSFSRNANFWDWMKDTYSRDELQRLAVEATDCSLVNPYDPLAESTLEQKERMETLRTRTANLLCEHYGDEIWGICLGAGGYDPDNGPTGLHCLARLELAFQVHNDRSFREFLVRNALKYGAKTILGKQATRSECDDA